MAVPTYSASVLFPAPTSGEVQARIGAMRYYLEASDSGTEWKPRFTLTLLFPKK